MATRMSDSEAYSHLWTSPELNPLFEERGRLEIWLRVLQALAGAQSELGIVPASSAQRIAELRGADLDLAVIAGHTRETSHSTLGLIRALGEVLTPDAHQHVYFGATVQDVSDTWFGIVMREVGDLLSQKLGELATSLGRLADEHRGTVMTGRTHGQPGAPITFGFKAASWADEVCRHLIRLREGRPRWAVGQLAGAVGVLGFFGEDGPALRARFCAELELGDPGISWTSSRDRVAEFGQILAGICGTLARIGTEVYELQRPEIGELREPSSAHGVGSITMPHKRNPEVSEHLSTLSRLARAQAGVLVESLEQSHERDGRGWKAEWIALPEICELSVVAANLGLTLIDGLEVDRDRMSANLAAGGVFPHSEHVLVELSARLGKHRAQQVLQEVLHGAAPDLDLAAALAPHGIAAADVRSWLAAYGVGSADQMIDHVLATIERTIR